MKKLLSILLVALTFVFCGCNMTEEEQKAYKEKHTHTYEVVSVYRYDKAITNNFGGVLRVDICYSFVYLDGNGNTKTVKDFVHGDYGLNKVAVGQEDVFVVYDGGIDTYKTLYLTKETMKKL